MSSRLVQVTRLAAREIVMQKKMQRPGQFKITEPSLESVLACPHCGFGSQETMPTDACLYYYECSQCKSLLRPKVGDCCVFCSYGSVKCPPMQEQRGCCG